MNSKTERLKSVLGYLGKTNWTRWVATLLMIYGAFLIGRSGQTPTSTKVGNNSAGAVAKGEAAQIWTCSMHPQIQLPEPGSCPICGMDLIELKDTGKDAGPRALVMSKSDMALLQVQTSRVERRFVESTIRMVGKVVYDETRVKSLSAWIPGRLDRLFVDYTGSRVEKGDHMVLLYSPDLLEAQQSLIEAKKSLSETANEKSSFLKGSALKHLESEREKLRLWGLTKEQIKAIEEKGDVQTHIQINAPLSGIVIHKKAVEGMYVKTGTPIYTVADLSVVWLELDAYEMDFPWVRYGQKVQIQTEAYPGEKFDGWISFVPPYLDERTRTKKVRVNVGNKDLKLKPGMFVRAIVRSKLAKGGQVLEPAMANKWICPMHNEVVKDDAGSCDICGMDLVPGSSLGFTQGDPDAKPPLVVPSTAVLLTGKRGVVYVQVPNAERPTFEGREVVVGPRAGDWYLISEGLSEGEMVVTNGNFKIDSALQILAKPSMMSIPGEENLSEIESTPAFMDALNPVYAAYFKAHIALSKDDMKAAQTALSDMAQRASSVSVILPNSNAHSRWQELKSELSKATEHVAHAGEIEGVRAIFGSVSKTILVIEKTFGHGGAQTYREAFCPMASGGKGAAWLQMAERIENPFYGSSMFTCGEIRGEFPGLDGKSSDSKVEAPSKKTSPNQLSNVDALFRKDLGPIYSAFMDLHAALAADKLSAAQQALVVLRSAAELVAPNAQSPESWKATRGTLMEQAGHGAHVKDLAGVRKLFNEIAKAVIKMEKGYGHPGDMTYHAAFCPMANDGQGGTWLQLADEVENPFFGASMYRCGEIKAAHKGVGK